MNSLARGAATRLSSLRQRSGQTQEDAGCVIDCSGGHISNIENHKTELKLSELESLATHFKVHPFYLIAGFTSELTELLDLVTKMEPSKRKMALKLFKMNLELMEISKNWPADTVNKT